jgi:hypothetical protein
VVSGSAIQGLGKIGPAATPAFRVLVPMIKDLQHRTHIMAIQPFWRIGPKGEQEASIVVPKLIDRLLTSKHRRERAWVAEILSEIGPTARDPCIIPGRIRARHIRQAPVPRTAIRMIASISAISTA